MRMGNIFNNKGQSILEYAIIIGLVVAGLTTMQLYIKRGIQAGIKVAADELGRQEDAEEIDPEWGTRSSSEINTITQSTERIRLFEGGSQRIDIDKTTASSGETEYISWE